jgi:parallel beta-helix repeat protein
VDNATDRDTIIVRSGTYYENVNVDKRLTIRSENGSTNCIVDAADPTDHVFEVTADYVNISGFTVKGATGWGTAGIYLKSFAHCNVSHNNASNNYYGIYLWGSSSNNIINNKASNNHDGIHLYHSSSNNITGNNALNNTYCGIYLEHAPYYSNNNTITKNTASNDYYGIILRGSSSNTITNNNASNNVVGIELSGSSNNNITNNTANSNNYGGINLFAYCGENLFWYYSNNNTVTKNTANSNDYGIFLSYSNNNTIYLNNFINNTNNVHSYKSTTIWNSTEKITYIYKGNTYTSHLGNYWGDYGEKYPDAEEIDGSGIWDTPYSIYSDADYYPLMAHWENYFAPENIFDTCSPVNPYPSIMGNHTGTIKPNHTVIATKLYTYSCMGTGGHTEYARIGNKTWNTTATWEGYAGDWHNISFDKTVVLLAGETYNYTVWTGSYPQIHHNASLLTTNGWTNCTKFTDANGKEYNDWIPAQAVGVKKFLWSSFLFQRKVVSQGFLS